MYKLAIIGGGPAGVAAGIYASRKLLNSILITQNIGGQSVVSSMIQNWVGTPSISGVDFAEALEEHLEAYANNTLDIHKFDKAKNIEKTENGFVIKTETHKIFEAEHLLITTGAHHKKLDVKGVEEFNQRGISYCASCDGPIFANEDVIIVGGGESGFESASELLAYAKSVTILEYEDSFQASKGTTEKILQNPKVTSITNAEVVEIKGDDYVNAIIYKDKNTQNKHEIPVKAVFSQIGMSPTTNLIKNFVDLDEKERIKIDYRTQRTSTKGIWAAGDCTDIYYHQNNIAAGDGTKALEDIYKSIYFKEK